MFVCFKTEKIMWWVWAMMSAMAEKRFKSRTEEKNKKQQSRFCEGH
jgi:hypothetical protein